MRCPGTDKERINHVGGDVFYACRIPARGIVLVNHQGTNTFCSVRVAANAVQMGRKKAVSHHVTLHA